jgi:tetratricopeptide (TPR) repeat protein
VPVSRSAPRHSASALDAMLAPFRAFVEGRAALETLEREAVGRACRVFEDVVQASPDYAPAHIGFANALALQFEAARAQAMFERDTLARALHHAGEACRLDPSSAEAWCVLGLASHQAGDTARALAAARRATALEPDNWRHRVRLAYVGWGEERLRAARRALELCPGLALAHWLAATVYIARQAFEEAERELVAGAAAQDRQFDGAKFRAAGLHLLLGVLRLSRGDNASAVEELTRELVEDERPQIFTAQARANAWCAIGAHRLRQTDGAAALDAFDQATRVIPDHPAALAARAAITSDPDAVGNLERRLQELRDGGAVVEAAFARAAFEALAGRPERAAAVVHAALEDQPAGSSGWTLPVDPLLHVTAHPEHWEAVLELLRTRAA